MRLWLKGMEIHTGQLSNVHEVAMGQRVEHSTTAQYHFCLLYRGAEPLLLSTRSDSERRDVSGHSDLTPFFVLHLFAPSDRSRTMDFALAGGGRLFRGTRRHAPAVPVGHKGRPAAA